MTTPFHAGNCAQSLLFAHLLDGVEGLPRSSVKAHTDLDPHQVNAALFALRLPYSNRPCWPTRGKGILQICTADSDHKLACEPNRSDHLQDPVVLAKARTAADNITVTGHAKSYEYRGGRR